MSKKVIFPVAAKKSKSTSDVPELFVYGYLDDDMAAAFASELQKVQKTAPKVVNVRVNSPGGSVYAGIAMWNLVRQCPCPIDMYVDGLAASMAGVFVMAGRNVYMSRYGRLMLHRPSGGAFGSAEKLRNAADEVEMCEADLTAMLVERTGESEADVKARYLNGKDNFFKAPEAQKAKLIDGIYDGEPVEEPETDEPTAVFEGYQVKLVAALTKDSKIEDNMREIPTALFAELCEIMGVTDSVSDAGFKKAFKKMADKANLYDEVKASLDQVKADAEKEKKQATANQVKALLDAAVTAKKINATVRAQFAVDYAENPDGLSKVLAGMTAYQPITDLLQGGEVPEAYAGKSWDELMEAGKIGEVKANHPDLYKSLYKKTFGKEPQQA